MTSQIEITLRHVWVALHFQQLNQRLFIDRLSVPEDDLRGIWVVSIHLQQVSPRSSTGTIRCFAKENRCIGQMICLCGLLNECLVGVLLSLSRHCANICRVSLCDSVGSASRVLYSTTIRSSIFLSPRRSLLARYRWQIMSMSENTTCSRTESVSGCDLIHRLNGSTAGMIDEQYGQRILRSNCLVIT